MSAVGLLAITLLLGALAAVMSVIAWRVARDERRRAEARIAALAAEIHVDDAPSTVAPTAPRVVEAPDLPLREAAVPDRRREPFHGVPALSGARYGVVAAIGVFVVASFAAVVVWLSSGPPTAPPGPVAVTRVPHTAAAPLELTALGHDRDGDRLTVRGVVRNPASAAGLDRTDAVVSVFTRGGAFIVSRRAPLRGGAPGPGHESTFFVEIPNLEEVGRYRVSFRSGERVVPHVDKREAGAMARAQ